MVFNWFRWTSDGKEIPKIHPTQKPVSVLKELIKVFTDEGDVVIDPCAGSGSTLRACLELGRSAYGFEIKKPFVKDAKEKMIPETLVNSYLDKWNNEGTTITQRKENVEFQQLAL